MRTMRTLIEGLRGMVVEARKPAKAKAPRHPSTTAGLGRGHAKIKGWDAKPAAVPGPGVVAHRDFAGHADGRYLLEQLMEASHG